MIHAVSGRPGSSTVVAAPVAPRAGGPRRLRLIAGVIAASAAMLACGSPEPDDAAEAPDTVSAAEPAQPGGGATPARPAPVRVDSAATEGEQAQPDSEPAMPALEAAIREMLEGPSDSQRAAGTHSWFSDTTAGALRSVTVDDRGSAVVDFADLRPLIPNASTSAGSSMLLRELSETVFAVPAIQSVEYRIEGSCEAFWEWLQYGGCQVQRRP